VNAKPMGALDRRVGGVLHVGTWLASAAVAFGLALPRGTALVTAGPALFIALPIVRLSLVLEDSLRRADYRIGGICAAVLLIILVGIALSVRMRVTGG
jgi:hypothetical protein